MIIKDSALISSIKLTVRTTNCLTNAGIKTIGEVRMMSDDQLLDIPNLGKVSLRELRILDTKASKTKRSTSPLLKKMHILLQNAGYFVLEPNSQIFPIRQYFPAVIERLEGRTWASSAKTAELSEVQARQIGRIFAKILRLYLLTNSK